MATIKYVYVTWVVDKTTGEIQADEVFSNLESSKMWIRELKRQYDLAGDLEFYNIYVSKKALVE